MAVYIVLCITREWTNCSDFITTMIFFHVHLQFSTMVFFHAQKGGKTWNYFFQELFLFTQSKHMIGLHYGKHLFSKCRPTTIGQWSEIPAVINGIQLCIVAYVAQQRTPSIHQCMVYSDLERTCMILYSVLTMSSRNTVYSRNFITN